MPLQRHKSFYCVVDLSLRLMEQDLPEVGRFSFEKHYYYVIVLIVCNNGKEILL